MSGPMKPRPPAVHQELLASLIGGRPNWQPTAKITDPGWLVVRFKEQTPEVWKFDDEAEARTFHDKAQAQWSECFLTRIVKQGAQLDVPPVAEPRTANGQHEKSKS